MTKTAKKLLPPYTVLLLLTLLSVLLILSPFFITLPGIHHERGDLRKAHLIFRMNLLLIFLIFQKRICLFFKNLSEWRLKEDTKSRSKVIAFGWVLLVSFLFQLHIGIFHPGAPGWDYHLLRSGISPVPPPGESTASDVAKTDFQKALSQAPATYLEPGYLRGQMSFLHFKTGEVLPFNAGLLGISWPEYLLGDPTKEIKRGDLWEKILKHSLSHRRRGKKFLFPIGISYPGHLNYPEFNYPSYPDPELLTAISFWLVTVEIKPDGTVSVIKSQLRSRVEL